MREIIKMLTKDEGLRLKAYKCPAGKLTIGVGRNIDVDGKGITEDEANYLLKNDILECKDDLKNIFPTFDSFPQPAKYALINMRFNLGPARFRGFKNMILAIKKLDWKQARIECLDSKAARELPTRYGQIANMLYKK